jgi:hypothetical protein
MGFHDWFRISVHAVLTDAEDNVLLLKATYGDQAWGAPGRALNPVYLSGVYAHAAVQSHAFVFRCLLPDGTHVQLSDEHSEFRYFDFRELPPVQRRRVLDCIQFDGNVQSARF